MIPEPTPADAAAALCLDCGLCCNGVLFDQVRLVAGDNAKALSARGLKLKQRSFFNQPCTALCGSQCTIYGDRPARCRKFECRQYQLVAAGEIPAASAAGLIGEVRCQVAVIEALLAAAGATNRRKPLAQRYATVMAAVPGPPDGNGGDNAALTNAMNLLQSTLREHFRVEADSLRSV
ncbi:MAG: YkgJ family cysteine cluster protein [Verrucomicrobiota bacterium]